MRAFDDEGNEVFPVQINTICPIEFAEEAKQISVEFMNSSGATDDQFAEMLPVQLAPIGTEVPTHIFCSRAGFTHELDKQLEWLSSQNQAWICPDAHSVESDANHIKIFFCTVTGDAVAVLDFLQLEEI